MHVLNKTNPYYNYYYDVQQQDLRLIVSTHPVIPTSFPSSSPFVGDRRTKSSLACVDSTIRQMRE